MEQDVLAVLRANAAVTALVDMRLNFGEHPQGQPLPAVVLNTVAGGTGYTLDGPQAVNRHQLQIDCYADTYGAAKEVSDAIKAALSGYRGGRLRGVFHVATRDGREGGTNEADRPFRRSLDFTIQHAQT